MLAEANKKRKHGSSKESGKSKEDDVFEWQPDRIMSEYEAARKEADNQGRHVRHCHPYV